MKVQDIIYGVPRAHTNHPHYLEQIEQFRFMTSKVLAKVFYFAVNGDIGAAKLYFNVMGYLNPGQTPNKILIQNQNNYIQINNLKLCQETIKNLNPEKLNSIESFLKEAITQPPENSENNFNERIEKAIQTM